MSLVSLHTALSNENQIIEGKTLFREEALCPVLKQVNSSLVQGQNASGCIKRCDNSDMVSM